MPSSSIQIANGHLIDPLNPTEDEIFIEDIAHALSQQCRFSGHVTKPYSVAEHCVRVSEIVPDEDKLWGLLHDASEYVLVDFPSPLKNDPDFGKGYRRVEDSVMKVITSKYGLKPEMPKSVKYADVVLLATEVRDLLTPIPDEEARDELWGPWLKEAPLPDRIIPWSSEFAREVFLQKFATLTREEGNGNFS